MRKIFTLFILLLLLPVTALAAAPSGQVLYVGGVQISTTGYWTTDSDGNVTAYTEDGTTPSNNYILYDKATNTLTLHNATIKKGLDYDEDITGGTSINDAAIGVFNQSGAAELTIILYGSNTIAGVGKGIYVLAHSQSTGSSRLTIMGNGSLDTSSRQTGIWVQSNSNNAALSIENAKVTATVVDGYGGNGVFVQSSENSSVSLTVNSGSLTATGSGEIYAGIKLQFGSGGSGSGTPTVTVSNNAIVRANGSAGGITSNSSSPIQYETGSDSTGGIVFDNGTGTVYGNVTLQEDLEIGEGESLTIGDGASLDTNGKTITVESGGKLKGTIDGKQPPEITVSPVNQTVEEGSPAAFSVTASAGEGEQLTYQWQQKTTDSGSEWMDISDATNATYTTGQTTMAMSGYQYRCVVTASDISVISAPATLTVTAKPTYTITAEASPAEGGTVSGSGSYTEGTSVTLTATVNSGYRFVGWMENGQQVSADATYTFTANSNHTLIAKFGKAVTGVKLNMATLELFTGGSATLTATVEPSDAANQYVTWATSDDTVVTVQATGNGTAIVTAVGEGTTTITVTTEDGGKKATCTVTVTHSMVHTPKKDATCTEDGNIEYWYCKNCDKYFSDENATEELSDVVIPATGHHYVNGYCTKCGHRDPDYRPDPISYYNIYIEDVCDGVEVTTSKNVVREGGSVSVYVKKDTANYTFDNFKVYYKRSYYGGWDELKEGTQPGEHPIKNIWTHIYIKAEGAEEKEDPTGIESIEGVKVYTKDGSLYVQTPQREQVIIVSMSGAVVKNEEQVGLKQYHGLQSGIYIVRVGDRAYKLRLN